MTFVLDRFRIIDYDPKRIITRSKEQTKWQPLILGDELASGQRRDSVLLLALGSIKQDIVNMELLEAVR